MTLFTMLRQAVTPAPPPTGTPTTDERIARLTVLVEEQALLLAALSARVAALEVR